MVWILSNQTEFAQKIDFLMKVPEVAPSTAEKMIPLQMYQIKENNATFTLKTTLRLSISF